MANYYALPTGAGAKTGADWANAFGVSEVTTFINATQAAGDRVFWAGGTYTLTASINTSLDGDPDNYIWHIGVNSGTTNEPPVATDYAAGDNRPLVAGGIYAFNFDRYTAIFNFRKTGTALRGISINTGALIMNCDSVNTSATTTASGIYNGGPYGIIADCTSKCAAGYAYNIVSGTGSNLKRCYGYESDIGCNAQNAVALNVFECVFDTCEDGIYNQTASRYQWVIDNCTIYNSSANGIYLNDVVAGIMNCTIDNCGTGISASVSGNLTVINYNNFNGNTSDVSNVTKGLGNLALDPQFTDAAGGNFTIGNRALINQGLGITSAGTSYVTPGAIYPSGLGGVTLGGWESGAWR